jgi:2'-5' RNA ligase superfamily
MTQIADHWWPRPGWRPGRTMYTFHVTFDALPEVGDLAESDQARLANLPGLDLIPRQWLHLTTQGVAFSDQISAAEVTMVTDAARSRLAAVDAPVITIGPAEVASEGIAYHINPVQALDPVRDAIRTAISDALGANRLLEDQAWTAHISISYANTTGAADIYEAALAGHGETVTVRVPAAQLILLNRGNHLYTWETVANLPLRQQ